MALQTRARSSAPPRLFTPLRDDDYMPPLTREQAERDLLFGQMAVVIHQGEEWPTGVLCRNCGGPWPCPLYRWGLAILEMAEWTTKDLEYLLQRAKQGDVPWKR